MMAGDIVICKNAHHPKHCHFLHDQIGVVLWYDSSTRVLVQFNFTHPDLHNGSHIAGAPQGKEKQCYYLRRRALINLMEER